MNQGRSIFSAMPPVVKNLIIINFIIWLAMILQPKNIGNFLMEYGALHYFEASDFNPAQLLTYMFIHSTQSIAHLFFNMFTLFMFGITLERVMGSGRFLFFYLSCGVGAALIQEGVWALMVDNIVNQHLEAIMMQYSASAHATMAEIRASIPAEQIELFSRRVYNMLATVGASGAIYGVLLAFGMIFPNRPLYLMFIPVPIKAKWMVIGYGVIEIALGLGANDGIAHFAHLGGMIFGLIIILYWKHKGLFDGYY